MSVGRITNLMLSQTMLGEINQSQAALDNTEEQLSTGLTINQPSDNPYGASLAVTLNGQLGDLTQYTDSITDATAWSQAASTGLTTIQQQASRAQELLAEASGPSVNQTDLDDIADEVDQLTTSVKQAADSQYDGQYIFSGSATATEPYSTASDAYQGNTGSVTRAISPGTSATVNVNLSSVLGSGQVDGVGDGGLLASLRQISSDLRAGDTSALSGADATALTSNLSSLEQLQTVAGTTQDSLQYASTRVADLQTAVTSQLSGDEDANMASTMTTYSNEQAAFSAALKAGASIVQSSLMDYLNT